MAHEYLDKIQKKNRNRELNKKQEEVKLLFQEEGLTDYVLERQIEINKERNKLDLPDENEFLHGKYVQ